MTFDSLTYIYIIAWKINNNNTGSPQTGMNIFNCVLKKSQINFNIIKLNNENNF